jgi:hypothetical protein
MAALSRRRVTATPARPPTDRVTGCQPGGLPGSPGWLASVSLTLGLICAYAINARPAAKRGLFPYAWPRRFLVLIPMILGRFPATSGGRTRRGPGNSKDFQRNAAQGFVVG